MKLDGCVIEIIRYKNLAMLGKVYRTDEYYTRTGMYSHKEYLVSPIHIWNDRYLGRGRVKTCTLNIGGKVVGDSFYVIRDSTKYNIICRPHRDGHINNEELGCDACKYRFLCYTSK